MRFPEKYRVDGNKNESGAFRLVFKERQLQIIASDQLGWDHVSVSLNHRIPNWTEMSYIKNLFFEPHEWAYQLHAPPSDHINLHPYVLHLWRPQDQEIPLPPSIMV